MSISIDIVILNYNTQGLLETLLPKVIEKSRMDGVSVVLADNCSTDGSVAFVRSAFPEIELIEIAENKGYAGGYNAALKNRKADYFILLNSDAEPEANWLEPLVDLIERDPSIGAIQPKLLDYYQRNKFEYAGACGGFIDKFGYPFCRGRIFGNVEVDQKQYDDVQELFWATGACFLVRRVAWEKAGGLDETFFAHMEEIDLCWRLQLLGYKILACPNSVVYHMGGGTLSNLSPRKTFLNFRNNLLMLHKNLHVSERDSVIFKRKLLDGLAACFFILQGKIAHIPEVWKAHKAFDAMKLNTPTNPRAVLRKDLKGMMMQGLVWNYFARGKKVFSKLME
jgi:GT2 family glycosyltransferase